jgi:hypothetical protein
MQGEQMGSLGQSSTDGENGSPQIRLPSTQGVQKDGLMPPSFVPAAAAYPADPMWVACMGSRMAISFLQITHLPPSSGQSGPVGPACDEEPHLQWSARVAARYLRSVPSDELSRHATVAHHL